MENEDFISEAIRKDLDAGRYKGVKTRFPPEPNGWLHIGHCKAFMIDFGMADKFGGSCNLRFDDTNPEKEDQSYVDAIKRDLKWMGCAWSEEGDGPDGEFFASDYYEYLYDLAVKIIKKGHAYVDDLSEEEMSRLRGTAQAGERITPPGQESPCRNRSIEENLDLFARMRAGEFPDGTKTLRAKINMADPNLLMRDPVMYRIRRAKHFRQGDAWCLYPMYDFAHPLSDAKEHITHSLCSLEYEIHRPLYDWFIREAEVFPSRQIEFARLNITHTVLSKRWLLRLVQEGRVSGWDDPRMPTIAGLRRRGYTPESIRSFISQIGISKTDSMVDIAFLEYCLREDLNKRALRVMAVLHPLKLIIDNWDGDAAMMDAANNPEDEAAGTRQVPFGRELWIEREDFEENPPPKYYRLYPGNSVRLRYAYIVTCTGCDKDAEGNITAVHCTYDPATKGGNTPVQADGTTKKIKGTIHWVEASHAVPLEARVYDYLFSAERPMDAPAGSQGSLTSRDNFMDNLNPNSLSVEHGWGEPTLANAKTPTDGGAFYQFERLGYFVRDSDAGTNGEPVFNKTIGLRDTWAKINKK
jgi:glutaminyl-tRNA synthetase